MKRLFIIGCPRSGSTWTMFLIAQHPDVVVCQHNRLFDALTGFQKWFIRMKSHGVTGPRFGMSVVVPTAEKERGEARGAKFLQLLPEDDFYTICRQAVSAVYDRIASHNPGAKVVVDKTPENGRQGEFILRVFPDAYFLHIMRDPRAVSSSVMAAARSFEPNFPPHARGAARMWLSDTIKGQEIGRLTSNYLEVRYESLKANGPEELQRIYSWLGLPSDPALCEKAVESSTIDRMRPMTGGGHFRKGETDSWRGDLSSGDVRIVEYLAGNLMDELGYQRTLPPTRRKPFSVAYADTKRAASQRLLQGVHRVKRGIASRLRRNRGETKSESTA